MPVEPNLHDLFRSATESQHSPIDAKAVIRRSRRRRLPSQIGAGSFLTLAIAGVGVGGITGVQHLGGSEIKGSQNGASQNGVVGGRVPSPEAAPNQATSDGAPVAVPGADPDVINKGGSSAPSAEGGIKRAAADKINLCGAPLAEVAPHWSGLELTVHFPDAKVGAGPIEGTVTLTNTGSKTVRGSSAVSPAITLSQNGITLWHSNGPMIAMAVEVELAPGESHEYPASFTPMVCAVEDDEAESFRADLPAAPAGEYQLSAAIDFEMNSNAELIVGPLATVTLHE